MIVKEGENEISIQVDAADQSNSVYVVKLFRPSGHSCLTSGADVSLRGFIVSAGKLMPPFDRSERHYVLHIAPNVDSVTITPDTLNPKSSVVSKGDGSKLHSGETCLEWAVTSGDKSVTESYFITVRKGLKFLKKIN